MRRKKRMRLYGKRATESQIINEIVRLLLGSANERPLTVEEIGPILGCHKATVYAYIKKAAKSGLLTYHGNNRLVIPTNNRDNIIFYRFDKRHPITQDKLVSEWKEDLLTRKQGEPVSVWVQKIATLERLCTNCMIRPKDLLVSNRDTEMIVKQYIRLYREGKIQARLKRNPIGDIKNLTYRVAQSVRDFCGYHGMTWRRGVSGVMSQKIVGHGKYADKRLTDEELEMADRFIKKRWGLDSDVYRWFWIGVESCARFSALYKMKLDYTRHVSQKTGKVTYVMTAYESKTKHIKGGKWVKYITRPDTQKSIDLLKSRGGTRVMESTDNRGGRFDRLISGYMKEIYSFLGKMEYFVDHPTHSLRHIGAHYWLAKTNYNYGVVAMIGGWNTIDELRRSYGEIPPEKVLEMIEEDHTSDRIPLLH